MAPNNMANDDEMKTYMRGSIVRIKLKDFMTYSECEFTPGPRLNVVIGPNGSGKSSIVCAVALGLQGSPKDLGRSSDISRFIRHGQNKGYIEIELYNDSGRNPVIRREIKGGKKGLTNWFLNGKSCNGDTIKELLVEYHIQVGNLCQVLPQDRVGDFSKFDEHRLLEETIKSTMGDKFIEKQDELIALDDNFKNLEKDLRKKQDKLERDKEENKRLQKEVEQLRKRKEMQKELATMQKLVPWLQFDKACVEARGFVTKKKEIAHRLKIEQAGLEPLKLRAEESKAQMGGARSDLKRSKKVFKASCENMAKSLKKYKVGKEPNKKEFDKLDKLIHDRDFIQEQIANAKSKVLTTETALSKCPTAEVSRALIQDVKSRLDPLHKEKTQLGSQLKTLANSIAAEKRELLSTEKELKKFEGQHEKKINILKGLHNYKRAIHAYNIIDKMRKEKGFQGRVHGPLVLELEYRTNDDAIIAEQLLPNALLTMYISENEHDRNKLMQMHGVNVFNVDPSTVKPTQRIFDIGSVKKYGIRCWGDEVFVGNDIVLEAIRRYAGVDRFLVGTKEADAAVDNKNLFGVLGKTCPNGSTLITTQRRYSSRRSKYGNKETVFSQSEFDANRGRGAGGARLCRAGNSLDASAETEKAKLSQVVEQTKLQIQQLSKQQESILKRHKVAEEGVRKLTDECKRAEKEGRVRKSLESRLKTDKNNLKSVEKNANKDFDVELDKLRGEITNSIMDRVDAVCDSMKAKDVLQEVDDVLEKGVEVSFLYAKYQQDAAMLTRANNSLSELQTELQEAEAKVKQLSKEAKQYKIKAEEEAPLRTYKPVFTRLREEYKDLEELEQGINLKKNAIDATMSNENLIKEFEDRERDIATLGPEVEQLTQQLASDKSEIDTKRECFEAAVQKTLDDLNTKFTAMFQEIQDAGYQCAGEVKFNKVPGDYRAYGAGIHVRFRAKQKMQQLSADVQSGGERSLSTFLYLLALQDLTTSPFRVVDEINQGMDAHKERLAFHRLIESSCREKLPQYFLITPKLLRGLKYTKDVTICFVYNGPVGIQQSEWDLESFKTRGEGLLKRQRITA